MLFRLVGLAARRRLRLRSSGRFGRDRGDLGTPAYLTTVIRLPEHVTRGVLDALAPLSTSHPTHHHYPPEAIHLTVLGLGGHPLEGHGARTRVALALKGRRPFEVRVRGLGLSPSTVFVKLYPRGPELSRMRRALRAMEPAAGGGPLALRRPLAPLVRRLAFANVVRFAGPVDPALVTAVQRLDGHDFGAFWVREVELVRADKVLSPASTTVLERYPLGP